MISLFKEVKRLAIILIFVFPLFGEDNIEEYRGGVFFPINQQEEECKTESEALYWFFGASEIGASYMQDGKNNQGIDIFGAIGMRYNFSKQKATLFKDGHSLALKVGVKYLKTISGFSYDDIFIPIGIEYSYASDALFGMGFGASFNYSALRLKNSNVSITATLTYLKFFLRGEYAIYALNNTSLIDKAFTISLGYKF